MGIDHSVEQWVSIATFGFQHEAELAASLLEAQGIGYHLDTRYTTGVDPRMTGMGGGLNLFVRQSDTGRAATVIAPFLEGHSTTLREAQRPLRLIAVILLIAIPTVLVWSIVGGVFGEAIGLWVGGAVLAALTFGAVALRRAGQKR